MSNGRRTWLQRLPRLLTGGVRLPGPHHAACPARSSSGWRTAPSCPSPSPTVRGTPAWTSTRAGATSQLDKRAAGPNSYVETVNQTVALYSPKATGTLAATSRSATSSPRGLYPRRQRLGPVRPDRGLQRPDRPVRRRRPGRQLQHPRQHLRHRRLQDEHPGHAGHGNFYKINTTETGYDADYPGNFGYNHDAFVFTLNMFAVGSGGGRPGRLHQ